MKQREELAQRLAELKAEFDASFTRPAARAEARWEVLLRLRVGGSPLAVPLERLAGLHALPRVVALPGSPPGLLGVAGLRGQLVAVHDLAARLGLPSDERPRWLLLSGGERRVGLAVGGFEGQLRVPPEQFQPHADAAPRPYLNTTVLRPGEAPLPVLDVASLVKDLLDGAQAPLNAR
ncbi:MAG: chemotaxis protein CheW [Hyalangium sp.]|uniref:chemotaxis protein CheW n=1 Tax=Hyalangium sp. TaxID=2028555 RepID=UPI003899F6CA